MDDTDTPMHHDQIPIDTRVARRLVAAQFPRWAELPLRRVASTGTVNAIFRLGDDKLVRLPLTPRWHDVPSELCWLDHLDTLGLPLAVPEVVGQGEPDDGYPCQWAVFRWIDGETWRTDRLADPCAAAAELADLLQTLQQIDPATFPCPVETGSLTLAKNDDEVRAMTKAAAGMLDTATFLAAWDEVLQVPAWDGPPVLLHGDVMAGNFLVRDGQLAAAIDWAGLRAGDPARDLMGAWTLFDGEARQVFRSALSYDDDTWHRARGWALTRISNVAYYAVSNPLFSADAQATIAAVLAEGGESGSSSAPRPPIGSTTATATPPTH